jgi:hypothetical protein
MDTFTTEQALRREAIRRRAHGERRGICEDLGRSPRSVLWLRRTLLEPALGVNRQDTQRYSFGTTWLATLTQTTVGLGRSPIPADT